MFEAQTGAGYVWQDRDVGVMVWVKKTRAIERLEKLVHAASELDPHDHRSQKFKKWTEDVYSAFIRIFLAKTVVSSPASLAVTQ